MNNRIFFYKILRYHYLRIVGYDSRDLIIEMKINLYCVSVGIIFVTNHDDMGLVKFKIHAFHIIILMSTKIWRLSF